MARLSLELPEHFDFSTEIAIYTLHINQGGHVDNALMLTLVNEARVRYFASLGYTMNNIEGAHIAVADAAVIYRSQAFYGDILVFDLAPRDFNKYGFDMVYRALEKTSGREIVRGKSGLVFVDAVEGKVTPVPARFQKRAAS